MNKDLQPAWVLSRRKYQDSGLLVELYTATDGRVGAIAKGAHRKQRGGALSSILQPFTPILVRLGGKSDLKFISAAEAAGQTLNMIDSRMLSGLYLNELLLRLSPRFDASPEIFASYGATLTAVSLGEGLESSLRRFEIELLNHLGYEISWEKDSQLQAIDPGRCYRYSVDAGFEESVAPGGFMGADLLAIGAWRKGGEDLSESIERIVRGITRESIDARLGGKPLNVRTVAQQWSEQRAMK